MRGPTELTDANPWVIEFRNGFYLGSVASDHSVTIEHAQRFASMRAVDDFVTRHEWILFNGGMPVEICVKCSKHVEERGQVHCRGVEPHASDCLCENCIGLSPRQRMRRRELEK